MSEAQWAAYIVAVDAVAGAGDDQWVTTYKPPRIDGDHARVWLELVDADGDTRWRKVELSRGDDGWVSDAERSRQTS